MIQINTPAPDFELLDQNSTPHHLSDYKGSWVLLYFYPQDDTSGCTVEACSVRDSYQTLQSRGVAVLGVSVDSVSSHKLFDTKYSLGFTLLSDEKKSVSKAYGVLKETGDQARRSSFLINPQGVVVRVYGEVNPENHIEEVLAHLSRLSSESSV
jgi:thioredoxin-dependent peroxiredoxin